MSTKQNFFNSPSFGKIMFFLSSLLSERLVVPRMSCRSFFFFSYRSRKLLFLNILINFQFELDFVLSIIMFIFQNPATFTSQNTVQPQISEIFTTALCLLWRIFYKVTIRFTALIHQKWIPFCHLLTQ